MRPQGNEYQSRNPNQNIAIDDAANDLARQTGDIAVYGTASNHESSLIYTNI